MLRPIIVLSMRNGHVASQDKSGPTKMAELYRMLKEDFEEMNRRFDKRDSYLDKMDNHVEYLGKGNQNSQRPAGLQL